MNRHHQTTKGISLAVVLLCGGCTRTSLYYELAMPDHQLLKYRASGSAALENGRYLDWMRRCTIATSSEYRVSSAACLVSLNTSTIEDRELLKVFTGHTQSACLQPPLLSAVLWVIPECSFTLGTSNDVVTCSLRLIGVAAVANPTQATLTVDRPENTQYAACHSELRDHPIKISLERILPTSANSSSFDRLGS